MTGHGWRLVMRLEGPWDSGERAVEVAVDLGDDDIVSEFCKVLPPRAAEVGGSWDGGIRSMRRREFRRSGFIREGEKLGAALADRLEDREGWNGMDRAERERSGR